MQRESSSIRSGSAVERKRRTGPTVIAIIAALGALGGCASVDAAAAPIETSQSAGRSPEHETDPAQAGTALAMLAELEVKGRAPRTGYDGDLFQWRSDVDHNGCDTRNDVLRRDLREITLGSKGCVVTAGILDDEYAGETYAFDRDPGNIDIDHIVIVARSNAWQTGAHRFDEDTLREFGNDPLNLLAVSSSLNRQKGDADAASWLPPAKGYRCEYVARQIAIKHKYGLWVVEAEKAAMKRVLGTCEDQPVFAEDVSWPDPGDSTHFATCTAARTAGAAPVHRGDPGYGPHLDRDGDGVACE